MTKQELIDYCLTYPAAYEDYPFDETTTLIRHCGNKKMFALIDHLNGKLHVTTKADFLRGVFESVTPGYHMNKQHWNTVYVGGDVPKDELYDMIGHSYDLIKPKQQRKRKKTVAGNDENEILYSPSYICLNDI